MLPKSSRRSIITYLVDHPTRFREAFALLRQDLRSLWLAAFQSEIWNDLDVPFILDLSQTELAELSELALPLPSARLHMEPGPLLDLYERVVTKRGLALRELRVKYPRDSFFSKGERQALVKPDHFRIDPSGDDDLNPGRQRLTVQFVLPRGSYATIFVKRLTQV